MENKFRVFSYAVVATISTFILFYLIGSFIAASFDISTWELFLRAVIGGVGGVVGIIIAIVTYVNNT